MPLRPRAGDNGPPQAPSQSAKSATVSEWIFIEPCARGTRRPQDLLYPRAGEGTASRDRRARRRGLGLLRLEGAFRLRDHGAFPHLNIYRPTPPRRAPQPGATENISFSDNPVSHVRINAQGYRGADWPAQPTGEIFVVGDSQAFGLGVDEAEPSPGSSARRCIVRWPTARCRPTAPPSTTPCSPRSCRVASRRPSSTPSTSRTISSRRRTRTSTRHAVWDGWAVRKETAPAEIARFPGRALLFRDSHAFFAARGLWFRVDGDTERGRAASEGSWKDVLSAGHDAAQAHAEAAHDEQAQRTKREAEIAQALQDRQTVDKELEQAMFNGTDEELLGDELGPNPAGRPRQPRRHRARVLRRGLGAGSAHRRGDRGGGQGAQASRGSAPPAPRRQDAGDHRAARRARTAPTWRSRGPIATALQHRSPLYAAPRARQAALRRERRPSWWSLVLPLDVQVSDAEWAKYGAASKLDLSSSRILARTSWKRPTSSARAASTPGRCWPPPSPARS